MALFRCMRGQGSLLRTSERSATLTSVPACTGAEFGLSTHDSRAWEGHGRVAAGPVVVIVTGPRVRRHTAARRERHASQARRVLGGLADGADVGAAPLLPLTGARRLIGHLGKEFGKSSGPSLSHSLNIARSFVGKKNPVAQRRVRTSPALAAHLAPFWPSPAHGACTSRADFHLLLQPSPRLRPGYFRFSVAMP